MPAANRGPRLDAVRAATALTLAIAQPLSTRMARWSGRGTPEIEQAAATAGPVTPADGAFVIWAPLFAGSLAYAAADLRAARDGDPVARAAGWWANATLAGNIAWSVNSQLRRLDALSVALIAASAASAITAVARAEARSDTPARRSTARLIAPLAGWLSVATFANVETAANRRYGPPERAAAIRRAVALVAAASTTASGTVIALRGSPGYALAAGWGLVGIAVKALRSRQRPVAGAAALGVLGLATATVVARHPRSRWGSWTG
jgi:hypothetical protein